MSCTEVLTETQAPTSVGVIHARTPHPAEPTTPPKRDSFDKADQIELAELNGASGSSRPDTGKSSPVPPGELSPHAKWLAGVQFATMCWTLFLAGWNDGTTGPMLPRIQDHYHVGYAIVALMFISNCIGFVAGAAANVHLTDKFGFGKVMVGGSIAQIIAYAIISPAPPFPVFVIAFAINGFGLSLQDAGANGFVASLKDHAETKMGILHAVYGLGALCSPLVSTQFSRMPDHWSFHYLVSLGISLLNTVLLVAVFKFKTQDECLEDIGQTKAHSAVANNEDNKYRQIFRLREVHLLAFFILIYVGVEVTLGGWTVTYIINERGGGPSSGYVSAGFFGGLTFGRVALLWVNKKIGEWNAIFIYSLLSIGLELVVWLVPSLIGGAVAVSLIGVFLGPIYPIVMNHSARILPHWLLTGSIGWIAGFGQAGSAFLPFLTGAIASREGIWALQPLMVAMMGFMMCLWLLVPRSTRRID